MTRIVVVGLLLVAASCSGTGKDKVDAGPEAVSFPDGRPGGDGGEQEGTPDVVDVGSAETRQGLPPGYMQKCLTDGDCSDWGLKCISEGPHDLGALCSKACTDHADCPTGLMCKDKGDQQVCLKAEYCDLCDNDAQCGSGGRCIPDKTGAGFCTWDCKKDDPQSCAAGNFCNKIGEGLEDYYCYPMFGQCKGDGSHCTPCQTSQDCQPGHVCHENAYTHERYCAKTCQTKKDCPKGYACAALTGEEKDLCTLEVEGEIVETCYKGMKSFCEPCMRDYECKEGVCYNYPVANKYFCSFFCDKAEYGQTGCPPGLFCVPNHGESAGEVCAPGAAFGCQGFLNCVAVECPKGMVCVGGFCEPK